MTENSERAQRISHALKQQDGPEGQGSSGRITKADYDDMMADRPEKFTPEEVGYRKAPRGSEYRCENCMHFYMRQVDRFHTCEIFRSPEVDERGVDLKYLCDWWTKDGEDFPLVRKEAE